MTQPALAKKKGGGYDAPRIYSWPPQPPHEFEVMSVTSIIGKAWPKPFLLPWAVKVTAQAAVDDMDIVQLMLAKGNERGAVEHLKGARWRTTNRAADRGTIVHKAVEAYVAGRPWSKEELEHELVEARIEQDLWRSAAGMIAGVMEFLWDKEPEILHSEVTVYSRTHGYAGTTDIIALMALGGAEKKPVIIDFKTSKSIYDDTALQLAAYANADFIGRADGSEEALLPDGLGPILDGVVVRPTATGRYEAAAFSLTPQVFEGFLACVNLANNLGAIENARRPTF